MAHPLRDPADPAATDRSEAPRPRPASESGPAAPSPARALAQSLARAFAPESARGADDAPWPPAATLAFVLATCGGFWSAVGLLALSQPG